MESSAKKGSSPLRVVFREGKNFVCGMCRKEHRDRLSAKDCLKQCMQELVMQQPLKLVKHYMTTGFQCQICKREYDSTEKSFECVKDCLETMNKKLASEYKAAGKRVGVSKPITLVMPTTFAMPTRKSKTPNLQRKDKDKDSGKKLEKEPDVGNIKPEKDE